MIKIQNYKHYPSEGIVYVRYTYTYNNETWGSLEKIPCTNAPDSVEEVRQLVKARLVQAATREIAELQQEILYWGSL